LSTARRFARNEPLSAALLALRVSMSEQDQTKAAYLQRARELRELAAGLKHESAAALLAMALQYERLAELAKGEKPN
jgi:hypothetical protein